MLRRSYLIPLLVVAIGAGREVVDVNDVVRGNNQFAVDLYGKTRDRPGNIFFSPYSISTALAMTSLGAEGETAREIASTLHLPADPSAVESGFAALQSQVLASDPPKPFQLDSANAL